MDEKGLSDPQALGRAVRVLREERGRKRADLARDAGISYTHLSEIENGKKSPSSHVLAAIAEALEVRPYEVLALADSLVEGEGITRSALRHHMASERAMPAAAYDAIEPVPRMRMFRVERPADDEPALQELLDLARELPPEDLQRLLDLARRLRG